MLIKDAKAIYIGNEKVKLYVGSVLMWGGITPPATPVNLLKEGDVTKMGSVDTTPNPPLTLGTTNVFVWAGDSGLRIKSGILSPNKDYTFMFKIKKTGGTSNFIKLGAYISSIFKNQYKWWFDGVSQSTDPSVTPITVSDSGQEHTVIWQFNSTASPGTANELGFQPNKGEKSNNLYLDFYGFKLIEGRYETYI